MPRLIHLFAVIALALALSVILFATMRPAQALSPSPLRPPPIPEPRSRGAGEQRRGGVGEHRVCSPAPPHPCPLAPLGEGEGGWGGGSEGFSISTDDGLSLTLSGDGQVIGLEIDGESLPIDPAPALWVRDMSAAGQVSEPNLLTNPGFEDGETGWQMGSQVGTDIALTDSVSRSGGRSLELHGVYTHTLGRATVIANPVAVTPGQHYRLSAYFLSNRGYVLGLDGTPPGAISR